MRQSLPAEPRSSEEGRTTSHETARKSGDAREPAPAFYALRPGGWRDYVTLLHVPYTAWHLSYVVVGGCLAASVDWPTLGWTVVAFALAMGVGAHALDELDGRPLRTEIPSSVLVALAVGSVTVAAAIGIAVALDRTLWIVPLVIVGAALVPAYNLELLGGRLHNGAGFALAWGAFPLLTGYFACAGTISWEALLAAAYATLMSYAQRVLSTPVRHLRRRVVDVQGTIELRDGGSERVTRETLAAAPERALQTLAAANVALAVALLVFRLA